MSEATIEIELLDSMLEDTPPCEIVIMKPRPHDCGNPAVARVKYMCPCWPKPIWYFTCQVCLDDIKFNRHPTKCTACGNENFEWAVS